MPGADLDQDQFARAAGRIRSDHPSGWSQSHPRTRRIPAIRLTKFTDYALRVLILAASKAGENVTIEEAAAIYGISAPHLKKVVRTLTRDGFLVAQRGRKGGFRLAAEPANINLGRIVRATEPDFALVECFRSDDRCILTRSCGLPAILDQALQAMFDVLDAHTLADLVLDGASFRMRPQKTAGG